MPGRQLAYFEPCATRIPVGTRIIAKYKDDDPKNTTISGSFYVGIVAEIPTAANKYRWERQICVCSVFILPSPLFLLTSLVLLIRLLQVLLSFIAILILTLFWTCQLHTSTCPVTSRHRNSYVHLFILFSDKLEPSSFICISLFLWQALLRGEY